MKSDDFSWLKDALSEEFPTAKIIIKVFERGTSSYFLEELGGHSSVREIGVGLRIEGRFHAVRFPIERVNDDGSIQSLDFIAPDQRANIIHSCLVVFLPVKSGRPPRAVDSSIGDFLGNSGPVLLNHAADLIEQFAPITAKELRRKAEFEQAAIAATKP